MMPPPLTIVAIATAAPGQEAALRAAQEQLVAETVQEPGCLRYELHQSREDGKVLVLRQSGRQSGVGPTQVVDVLVEGSQKGRNLRLRDPFLLPKNGG